MWHIYSRQVLLCSAVYNIDFFCSTDPGPGPLKEAYIHGPCLFSRRDEKSTIKTSCQVIHFQLDAGEPWDTMRAQLLSKINNALQPQPLDFTLFDISFTIPCIVPKPRMPLETEASYSILLQRVSGYNKAKEPPIIGISICQKHVAGQQEDLNNANNDKGKKKSRDPAMLPGHVKKNENMKALRERWVCPKKQAFCLGMHCFINEDGDERGAHLPLSHERLDCWAAAMVSACVYYMA